MTLSPKARQAVVYNKTHDSVLKQALKNRKSATEVLGYGAFETLVQDLLFRRFASL